MSSTKPWPQVPVGNKERTSAAVVIIGAGISGICQAIDLIKRVNCYNFVILEKSSSVGGTWSDNKYPGCCCDVWSLLYSYSFEQNAEWTREYPGQEEILSYLKDVAAKWNLYKHIRFNTAVESASWDQDAKKWRTKVKLAEGTKDAEFDASGGAQGEYLMSSDFLISAVGQLNMPKWPELPGLGDFQGKLMHSARWDWGYDIKGKKIALIGNGATAAQIAPEIAKEVNHLTIYQRTPNWIILRLDAEVSPLRRAIQKYFPPYLWRIRAGMMDFRESFLDAVWDAKSPLAEMLKQQCLDQMHTALPNQPDLWKKLTPDYNIGCKRVIISDDYYPTIARNNVTLETRLIERITSTGITVNDATSYRTEEEYDLIVCATGFRTLEFMHPIKITGQNGKSLNDIWDGGARAYRGVSVPELPNFGMLYGPNTNLGHNSIILMIEAQSKYLAELAGAVLEARMRDPKGTNAQATLRGEGGSPIALVPKKKVVEEFNDEVQRKLEQSSFADPNCNSWYKDPKTGRITNNWSGSVVEYQKMMETVPWDAYEDGDAVIEIKGQKEANLPRVREETLVSDRLLAGLGIATVAVGVLGWVGRNQRFLSQWTTLR